MNRNKLKFLFVVVILFVFSSTSFAKFEENLDDYTIEVKTKDNGDMVMVGYLVSSPMSNLGELTEQYIGKFRTEKTAPEDVINDIGKYMVEYGIVYDYNAKASQNLDTKRGKCYHLSAMATKLLEKTNMPYKIVLIHPVSKSGVKEPAHNLLVTRGSNGKPLVIESTWFIPEQMDGETPESRLKWLMDNFMVKGKIDELLRDMSVANTTGKVEVYMTEWLNNGIKTNDLKSPIKATMRYMNMKTGKVDYLGNTKIIKNP